MQSHPEIITSDIPDVLDRSLAAGNRKAPLLLAAYGIGKSMQGHLWSASNDFHYIDYRAAYKSFNDVRGFGVPDRERQLMTFLRDEDFDFHPEKRNCIHFEELLNAPSHVQKVLMQLILDDRIGTFRLPKGTFKFASSNRLAHKTGVERMLAALADRFAIYHIRPDLDSFTAYLEANGKSAEVLAFINANSDAPYNYDIAKWDGESNLPTFRSFERLDELVSSYPDTATAAADRLLSAHAAGCIGGKYGASFAQFLKLTHKIGDISKMVDEADTCTIPTEADIRWVIACRLITFANKQNLDEVLLLAHRLSVPSERSWKASKEPSAFQTYVCKAILRRRPEMVRTVQLLDWQQRYADVLTSI
jgi:hypothetical protein